MNYAFIICKMVSDRINWINRIMQTKNKVNILGTNQGWTPGEVKKGLISNVIHKTIQMLQIIILLGLLLLFPAPNALAKTYQLNVSGSRMIADFDNMPLSAVIADIGAKTGIQFLFLGGAAATGYNTPSSFKFESLPIRKALEKLLSNFNYSLISDGNDNIRQVFILGSKSAPKTLPTTQQPFVMAAAKVAGGRGATAGSPPGQDSMEIGQGEGMQIGPPGAGDMSMETTGGGEMTLNPSDSRDLSGTAAGAQQMSANPSGVQSNPGAPVRRPSRWALRKK